MIHLLGICIIKGRGTTHVHLGYDPKTDTYITLPPPKLGRQWAVCAYYKSKIFLIGGFTMRRKARITGMNEIYDVKRKRWTQGALLEKYRRYGCGRENPIIDGRIYVTHGQFYEKKFLCGNLVYDIEKDRWVAGKSARICRDGVGCATVNEKLHVIGGRNNGNGLNFHEVYDPKTDRWRFRNPLPINRADISCVVIRNKIYCFGGYGGRKVMSVERGNVNADVYEYNPKTNIWKEKQPMPTARWGVIAVTDGRKAYVFAGGVAHCRKNDKYCNILEIFDPSKPFGKQWKVGKRMAIIAQGLMGVFIPENEEGNY